jgi:hypothetical protein
MFNKTKIGARALATLSDRQQFIVGTVSKEISPTLAEWIAAQFIAGQSVELVWAALAAARELDPGATATGRWIIKSAYDGKRIKHGDTLRHSTIGLVWFDTVTADGMVRINRPDATTGDFLPTAFAGVTVERE